MIYNCEVEFTTCVTLEIEAESKAEAGTRAIALARVEGISAPYSTYDYRVLSADGE